jgi:Spy/CpxP family protein refolding chaperone
LTIKTEEERKMKLSLKKKSGIIAIAGAFLLAMAMVAFSQEGRPPGPPPGGGFRGGPGGPRDGLGPIARDLNLTDDQKAQIRKITASFEESTKTLRDQMKTLHESGSDPLSGAAFDEAAVRAAAQARANVQIEMEVARAKMMSQIFAVLTTDQKAQLAAKRQQFKQRRPGGPGGPEGPPPGEDAPNN